MTTLFAINKDKLHNFVDFLDDSLTQAVKEQTGKYGFDFDKDHPLDTRSDFDDSSPVSDYKWALLSDDQHSAQTAAKSDDNDFPKSLPQNWSFKSKFSADLHNRVSVSTKASSSYAGDNRQSRISVLEMLTDRSRSSTLNHVPSSLQRHSDVVDLLDTQSPEVIPDPSRNQSRAVQNNEDSLVFGLPLSSRLPLFSKRKNKWADEHQLEDLGEVNSSNETDGIEDELRPNDTLNSDRKLRKDSFQEKNKITGIPHSASRSRKASYLNEDEEQKSGGYSAHRTNEYKLSHSPDVLRSRPFHTEEAAEEENLSNSDDEGGITHPQKVYKFKQNLIQCKDSVKSLQIQSPTTVPSTQVSMTQYQLSPPVQGEKNTEFTSETMRKEESF